MSFNIQEWRDRVEGTLLFTSKYDFEVSFPVGSSFPVSFEALEPSLGMGLSDALRLISDRCVSTAKPGQALRTTEINRHGVGVREKFAFASAYTDLPCTFYAHSKGDAVQIFWKSWLEHAAPSTTFGSRTPYLLEYKNKVTAQVKITQYDIDGTVVRSVYLNEAYPVALNDMHVSWMDHDRVQVYSVVLTYIDWGFNDTSSGSLDVSTE